MQTFSKTQKIAIYFVISSLLIFTGSLLCNMYISLKDVETSLKIESSVTKLNMVTYSLHLWTGGIAVGLGVLALGASIYHSTQTDIGKRMKTKLGLTNNSDSLKKDA